MAILSGIGAFFTGVNPKVWKFLGVALAIGAVVFAVWKLLDNMTDTAYAQGKSDGVTEEHTRWVTAEEKFKAKTADAKLEADRNAAQRQHEHEKKTQKDREKINEAIAESRSPIDVLFPSSL